MQEVAKSKNNVKKLKTNLIGTSIKSNLPRKLKVQLRIKWQNKYSFNNDFHYLMDTTVITVVWGHLPRDRVRAVTGIITYF